MVKWIESSRCRWDRRLYIHQPLVKTVIANLPPKKYLKSSNCVVCSVPHFLLDVLHLPPRFPDLGDPDDETSGTLDGVTWMDAFVVKIHPDHFVPWMSVGWNRVNQGNSATKVKFRWVGKCCPGLSIIRFVDLLKIAFRDRYLRFVECHNSPRVHSLIWHFQGKINDFYIGRGVDPAYVLRSTFTVNEFIPLLHVELSYQYFPSLVKHIEIRVRRIGISCDWTALKSLRNDHVNGTKRIIPEHRTIVAQAIEHIPGCSCFAHGKPLSPLFVLDADVATGKRVLRGEIRIGLCEALGIASNTTMDHGSWTIFLGLDMWPSRCRLLKSRFTQ